MQERYKQHIKNKNWYQNFREKTKHLILPGFNGVPLYDILAYFIKGVRKGSLSTRASAIAFKFFLAIFPSIIIFFTIIPYIPVEGIHETLMELIREFMPHNAFKGTEGTIEDIINHKRGGLLSIGALMTIYFATNAVTSIIESFNNTIHIDEKRSFLKKRITAIMLVFILSMVVIVAIALIIFGTDFLHFLVSKGLLRSGFELTAIEISKWIVSAGMLFFLISFVYYLAPARQFKFRLISAGSTLATALSLLITLGFKFFVSNFGNYNAVYGSIGTLIVIMLFIYLNSLVLLIGFELNASIRNASLQGTNQHSDQSENHRIRHSLHY